MHLIELLEIVFKSHWTKRTSIRPTTKCCYLHSCFTDFFYEYRRAITYGLSGIAYHYLSELFYDRSFIEPLYGFARLIGKSIQIIPGKIIFAYTKLYEKIYQNIHRYIQIYIQDIQIYIKIYTIPSGGGAPPPLGISYILVFLCISWIYLDIFLVYSKMGLSGPTTVTF